MSETTSQLSNYVQESLLTSLDSEQKKEDFKITKINKSYSAASQQNNSQYFQLQNRRFLGNKYKLLGFIEDVIRKKIGRFDSLCDIFAGTGVVGEYFNQKDVKIISNDLLASNYIPIKSFLGIDKINLKEIKNKIEELNKIKTDEENYFSKHFGGTYFTKKNAKKIGFIRKKIDDISDNKNEKALLITSLIYAADKTANTVGHYDAYRKKLDTRRPLKLLLPDINLENNQNNEVYKQDANQLIKNIDCDILYIDPPYNSRQYSDAYHLLENLTTWEKPSVHGKAKKMDRSHIKSDYCLQSAAKVFADLISKAECSHILLSYNNTGESKDDRSNARIKDDQIINILNSKGDIEIFEQNYQAFTTGRSETSDHTERLFYCKVKK